MYHKSHIDKFLKLQTYFCAPLLISCILYGNNSNIIPRKFKLTLILACDKFSSCIISCQCIITSLFQHKKLYTIILVNENDETMHWLEMVLGDIACMQLDTGTDSKVNSR